MNKPTKAQRHALEALADDGVFTIRYDIMSHKTLYEIVGNGPRIRVRANTYDILKKREWITVKHARNYYDDSIATITAAGLRAIGRDA